MDADSLVRLLNDLGFDRVTVRNRNVMACCPNPMHQERRPSWGVSIDPPHQHGCFSCGFKGTLSSLLRRLGVPFNEDDVWSSKFFPEWKTAKNEDTFIPAKGVRMYYMYRRAIKSPEAKAYLKKRGISESVAEQAELRYDLTQMRLLFPWRRKEILYGATGRLIQDKEGCAKTIPYFDLQKRNLFYMPVGFSDADTLVLCEGEIDALHFVEGGVFNVAALGHGQLSTAAFSRAKKDLPKLNTLVAAFDNDEHGEQLTQALSRLCRKAGMKCYQAYYPGKDPGECAGDALYAALMRAERIDSASFPSWKI